MTAPGRRWGHMEDGVFRPLPHQPLIDAGYTCPPFDIEIRAGVVRRVVVEPEVGDE